MICFLCKWLSWRLGWSIVLVPRNAAGPATTANGRCNREMISSKTCHHTTGPIADVGNRQHADRIRTVNQVDGLILGN